MTESIAQFDLRHPPAGFHDDPYPWYRQLRESRPVHLSPDGSYLLTRYADCAQVYRESAASSDKKKLFKPLFGDGLLYEHHTSSLVFCDPPYHTRVRALLADALKPAAVRAMADSLRHLVNALLDDIAARGEPVIDFVTQYAGAIPLAIIGDLLTVPLDERAPLRNWSMCILGALEFDLGPGGRSAGERAVSEFIDYLRSLVSRRKVVGAPRDGDLLGSLLASHARGDLSEKELLHNCIFLLNAGHETTGHLLANGVYELLIRPGQLQQLRTEPSLMKSAIEEILRFQSPNQLGNRELTSDVDVGGARLPRGAQVTLVIGAANRDPLRFHDPESFDIRRDPNPHLAFATGPHMCLGMALARLEAQIALSVLLTRCPELRHAGPPLRAPRARFRGVQGMPVHVGRVRPAA
ncbi:MAG: cytochrome P450 [Steroidobacteraceae bacterium]